jgi:hypothetical protein
LQEKKRKLKQEQHGSRSKRNRGRGDDDEDFEFAGDEDEETNSIDLSWLPDPDRHQSSDDIRSIEQSALSLLNASNRRIN